MKYQGGGAGRGKIRSYATTITLSLASFCAAFHALTSFASVITA
jgi:hypothetical protein